MNKISRYTVLSILLFLLIMSIASATTTTRYIGNVAQITGGNISYKINDRLGSQRIILNEEGETTAEYKSLPFGQTIVDNGSKYGFTGKEKDVSTDLHYFGARYYDSDIGRFTSVDPIGDGVNHYAYVGNNPMNYVDPSGMDAILNKIEINPEIDNLYSNEIRTLVIEAINIGMNWFNENAITVKDDFTYTIIIDEVQEEASATSDGEARTLTIGRKYLDDLKENLNDQEMLSFRKHLISIAIIHELTHIYDANINPDLETFARWDQEALDAYRDPSKVSSYEEFKRLVIASNLFVQKTELNAHCNENKYFEELIKIIESDKLKHLINFAINKNLEQIESVKNREYHETNKNPKEMWEEITNSEP